MCGFNHLKRTSSILQNKSIKGIKRQRGSPNGLGKSTRAAQIG